MKKPLKIVLSIVAIIVLGITAVFYFTADMVTVADEFLNAVKSKDFAKAYSYASDDFKAATSKDALGDFLSRYGLTGFKSASWTQRSISGNRGELTGSVSTESGGVVPIKLSLVKGESGWRIYSLEKPASGIQERAEPRQPPSEEEQVKLVSTAMHVFAVSVNEKDMAKLHGFSSNLMQQQYTIQKLTDAFNPFYKLGVDLTLLDKYSPIFDGKASINDDGVLVIKGYYPTKPSQVYFEQKYIYEGMSWKLLGISVDIH
jgi:hypothetical protein